MKPAQTQFFLNRAASKKQSFADKVIWTVVILIFAAIFGGAFYQLKHRDLNHNFPGFGFFADKVFTDGQKNWIKFTSKETEDGYSAFVQIADGPELTCVWVARGGEEVIVSRDGSPW